MPVTPVRELRVEPGEAGRRLDLVLASRLGLSRARVQEWIRDGGVSVQGSAARKPSFALEPGWTIELRDVPRSRERAGGSADLVLRVVYEDEHLAVVDKPAGMVTHPSSVVRGGTVSERAVARWGPLPTEQGDDRPGIVHRLDAETSGLLIVAKRADAARALVELFRERRVEKEYLALVEGVPRFDSDWIAADIGRSSRHSDRMSVIARAEGDAAGAPAGRPAETFYETRERFREQALVACFPKTGRTHQIRVHLAHLGHPILGDRLYRARHGRRIALPAGAPPLERQLLHARALRFAHPASGERLELEAEPPADFAAWLAFLRAARAT